ncbi:8706_t:CDS:2 [Dentiscutata erythropus]|uniref:8706_t:CDS:1 n=1 Tax=Dentiscutata erythropus TaxID=1348616 RepID=A0A9N9B227_9GLOM|nr:8706_t:CDS:2 [Dentiscutata erythropus]
MQSTSNSLSTSSTQNTSNVLNTSSTPSDSGSNIQTVKSVNIENSVDMLYYDTKPDDHFLSDNENLTDNASKNESTLAYSNFKRKDRELVDEDENINKKACLASTIRSMHNVQLQIATTIQDMKQKIDEIHGNLKVISANYKENDAKWIEDAIGGAVYKKIGQVKYPIDEQLMKVCYDALSDIYEDEFQNKIKNSGWPHFFHKNVRKIAQKFAYQGRSSIVQRIKDTVHSEFTELVKPKTENRQISHEEEQKFKDADIT